MLLQKIKWKGELSSLSGSLSFLAPSSVLPPHWLLNFRCPFSRVQPLGESWEFSAPVYWNMWSGCFAAGTTEIKPTSQRLAPCQRGPRDAAVLWKDTCESSRPPQPAVRTMRLGGSLEHKAVQIIWKPQHHGISLQVLQSKKKKKKDSTSLTVQRLDDKSLVVVWIIPEQVTEGLLCSIPKAISQSVSYPHLIFFPPIPSIFFLKFPGPHGTQGIWEGGSRSVSSQLSAVFAKPGQTGNSSDSSLFPFFLLPLLCFKMDSCVALFHLKVRSVTSYKEGATS